jgi:glycosidase
LRALFCTVIFLLLSVAAYAQPGTTNLTDDLSVYRPVPYVKLTHPEWSRNATIYQINLRQFTPEGTLRSAELQLPRLHELGVGILWLMPINPIGKKNRKGTLGSPYAVQDYYGVNPEFGTLEDLKHFVAAAHRLGMHVILDWVANHTAWDNVLVAEHPEWYARDWKGDFTPTPWLDWGDIIDLDYSHAELRRYMTAAMKYWVREADIDGYRCDVAGFVPVDFWNQVRKELDAIKPVFMLAEWETRDLHERAFDMTYAWTWYDAVHDLTTGKARDLGGLVNFYSTNESAYPPDVMRMTFLSNHDKNAWDGTEFEQFGAGVEPAMVLSMTSEGMPLIYNGQEAGSTKRLKFFERDPIVWKQHPNGELYRKLIALKKQNTALWNAHWGAKMINVPNSANDAVLSFVRRNSADKVFVVINFSGQPRSVRFKEALFPGAYTEFFSGQKVALDAGSTVTLGAWGYRIFVK